MAAGDAPYLCEGCHSGCVYNNFRSIKTSALDTMVWSELIFLFSSSLTPPLLLKPPVQIYGIEGRYATALYSAASKQNKLEQVEKELLRVGVSSFPVHC